MNQSQIESFIWGVADLIRDTESVPLAEPIEAFFEREVKPHVPDAWIDTARRDPRDGEVGIVGQEVVAPEDAEGAVARVLLEAMERPLAGPPFRPDRIRVVDAALEAGKTINVPAQAQTGRPTARISSRALLFSTTPGRIR